MGFEEVTHRVWWMEEEMTPPWYNTGVSDIEVCRSLCLNYSCISFTQSFSDNVCVLHDGHWYHPDHYRWVMTGLGTGTYNGHRLCFKGIILSVYYSTCVCYYDVFWYPKLLLNLLTIPCHNFLKTLSEHITNNIYFCCKFHLLLQCLNFYFK